MPFSIWTIAICSPRNCRESAAPPIVRKGPKRKNWLCCGFASLLNRMRWSTTARKRWIFPEVTIIPTVKESNDFEKEFGLPIKTIDEFRALEELLSDEALARRMVPYLIILIDTLERLLSFIFNLKVLIFRILYRVNSRIECRIKGWRGGYQNRTLAVSPARARTTSTESKWTRKMNNCPFSLGILPCNSFFLQLFRPLFFVSFASFPSLGQSG